MWTGSEGPIPPEMIQKADVDRELDSGKKNRLNGQTARKESTLSIGQDSKLEVGQELVQLPHLVPPAESRLQLTEGRQNNQVIYPKDDSMTTYVSAHTIPEDVWLKIFEMLDSSKDLSSCFRTCKNWNKWIMGKQDWLPTVFFPKVAPLLLEKLTKSDFLECRKVCRIWKEGIDHAYQTHPQHIRLDWEAAAKEANIRLPKLVNDFPSSPVLRRFLRDMESHRGNPFVGRAIRLNCTISLLFFLDEDDEEEVCYSHSEYCSHVIQLLDLFGTQVHFATIDLNCHDFLEDAKELVTHLRNCLLRLPNLRRLKITGLHGAAKYRKEIQDHILAIGKSMPLLVDLETLEMELQTDLLNNIMKSFCVPAKIKRLEWEGNWEFSNTLYQFPNLEVIKSTLTLENLERFGKLVSVPPLRELDLHIFGFPDYPRVFKSLELFGGSLTNAKLKFSSFFSHGNGSSSLQQLIGTINLPKLKRFVLVDYDGPLDPFFELNSLQHLEIDYQRRRSDTKFHAFVVDMHYSNVWSLMPSLKMVLVSFGSCKVKFDRKTFENNPGAAEGARGIDFDF